MSDYKPAFVVLDPEDMQQVKSLVRALAGVDVLDRSWDEAVTRTKVARALKSLTRPPKPPEPTGLGAVVEDAEGVRYVRVEPGGSAYAPWEGGRYIPSVGRRRPWSDVKAVRVLSPGVES